MAARTPEYIKRRVGMTHTLAKIAMLIRLQVATGSEHLKVEYHAVYMPDVPI